MTRPIIIADSWPKVIAICYEEQYRPNSVIHLYPGRPDSWDRIKGLDLSKHDIHVAPHTTVPDQLADMLGEGLRRADA